MELTAADGDILVLTADTAGKVSSPYKGGVRLSNEAFERKVNAGAHIDELTRVSTRGKDSAIDEGGKHGATAEGGWNYRAAYFQDFDGKYYLCTVSVAIGKDGNIVYNIGDMQERSLPTVQNALTGSSAEGGAQRGETSSKHSIYNAEEKSNSKFSVDDAAYLSAVESVDIATAQRMVDEAAQAAGYTVKAYHGTKDDFTVFNRDKGKKHDAGWLGRGHYFSEDERVSEEYAGYHGKVVPVYLQVDEPYYASVEDNTYLAEADDEAVSEAFTQNLISEGYDGVFYDGDLRAEWVVFDSEQIKSADPVTYDDDGNVIPLSERFNEGERDIRYSVDENFLPMTQVEIQAVQSIGRKSINAFSSKDIAATERFARAYWREMGVKSPFFRAWFGDWRINDTTPVQVAKTAGDARGVQRNDDTGWDINVSAKVFAETKAHSASSNQNASPYLSYINDIVKKAVLLDSFAVDNPKSDNTLLMHSLYAVADIGNGSELLKLYVEEMNDPNKENTTKRAYQLQNIERQQSGVKGSGTSPSLITQTAGIRTVSDLFGVVKSRDANFTPNPCSVVVDKAGMPLKVYHGTPHGGFTVFKTDDGAFFTPDKEYARLYTRGNDYNDSDAEIYEGYLNIKKPFDTRNAKEKSIFMREFYMQWGNGTPLSDNGLPDWTDGSDLVEFLSDKGYDYDGVLISESNAGKYEEVSYMALSPEQFKSDGNIGTFDADNADIRYSLDDDADIDDETLDVLLEAAEAEDARAERMKELRTRSAENVVLDGMKKTVNVNQKEKSPMELTTVKEIYADPDTELRDDPDPGEYGRAVNISIRGIKYGKDLSRNLDAAAGSDADTRNWLREKIERPLHQAKAEYARRVSSTLDALYDKMKELGIKAGSAESAAIQWYGEGQRQDRYGPCGLRRLKKAQIADTATARRRCTTLHRM